MKKTLYSILGVEPTASPEQIRAAYDVLRENTDPEDGIQRVASKDAWDILSHPERRAKYDASQRALALAAATVSVEDDDLERGNDLFANKKPILAVLLVFLLLGGWYWWHTRQATRHSTGPLVAILASELKSTSPQAEAAASPASVAVSVSKSLSSEALFAKASASIVRINALGPAGDSVVAFGSGVIIDRATVITNCHVAQSGNRLRVNHQKDQYDASIFIADEVHDLCKLSVPGLTAPAVTVAKVAGLKVGQKVYAIGSPQGLDLTLSDGMVSSLREFDEGTVIQTTAPTSPGSSGGGLFDEYGQLIGIVTFQAVKGQNLNFAIPADWIASMSNTHDSDAKGNAESTTSTKPGARGNTTLVVGAWQCYGPLTGRGLEIVFADNGIYHGMIDGRPVGGNYSIYGTTMNLADDDFQIEELNSMRMVLSKGDGRRMVCQR